MDSTDSTDATETHDATAPRLPRRHPAGSVTSLAVTQGALVVTLAGVLTAPCCIELRAALLRGRPDGVRDVHLDAQGVTAIEDAVLGVLLACSAYVHSTGGEVRFVAASASVRRAVSALGLTSLFPLPGELPVLAGLLPRPRTPMRASVPV